MNMYHSRGLTVNQLNTDNEFACIEDEILPTKLNMVVANENVGDVERSVRTVKECIRCHVHMIPYERYPRIMVTGIVIKSIKDINQLPAIDGISKERIPDTLVTGRACPDYDKVTRLNFGDYVQAYHRKGSTNTNQVRTVGPISLYSSGNEQEGGTSCR